MAERSKAPDSRVKLFLTGVFWSTNVGVGSNPTSDKRFRQVWKIQIQKNTKNSKIQRTKLAIGVFAHLIY